MSTPRNSRYAQQDSPNVPGCQRRYSLIQSARIALATGYSNMHAHKVQTLYACMFASQQEPCPPIAHHAGGHVLEYDGVEDIAVLAELLAHLVVGGAVCQIAHIQLAGVRQVVPRPPSRPEACKTGGK